MSIYDDIASKHQPAPTYPRRSDFIKHYGYVKGQNLGLFDTVADAKTAGAVTMEKTVDEDGFKAVQDTYQAWNAKLIADYHATLRAEYPELNDKVYALVYAQAYEDGHSAGHGEIENYMIGYADLALKIIAAAK